MVWKLPRQRPRIGTPFSQILIIFIADQFKEAGEPYTLSADPTKADSRKIASVKSENMYSGDLKSDYLKSVKICV